MAKRNRNREFIDGLDPDIWEWQIDKNKSPFGAWRRVVVEVTHRPSGRKLRDEITGNLTKADLRRHVNRTVQRFVEALSK